MLCKMGVLFWVTRYAQGTIPEQEIFLNNASNEQFSLALQYVSSSAPSALPDKEIRDGFFAFSDS